VLSHLARNIILLYMEITPAIMPQSYDDIVEHVERVIDEAVSTVQIDIVDGRFVSERYTWPFLKAGGGGLDERWQELQNGLIGLPHWQDIDYDIDLMILDPYATIYDWITLGPKRITLHIESMTDPVGLLQQLQDVRTTIEIGLAINNETPLDVLYPHIGAIDYVQLMGIAKIGFQNQPFDIRVIERIKKIKSEFPSLLIQVDGAVNNETIEQLEELGIDRCVVGSAFFGLHNGII